MSKTYFSKAISEIEEWMSEFTYDFNITYAEAKAEGEVRVGVEEIGPDGVVDEYFFTVESNGIILNNNGEDIIVVAIDAYSDDPDMLDTIKEFAQKYYDEPPQQLWDLEDVER